jgi:hypothetical protein
LPVVACRWDGGDPNKTTAKSLVFFHVIDTCQLLYMGCVLCVYNENIHPLSDLVSLKNSSHTIEQTVKLGIQVELLTSNASDS